MQLFRENSSMDKPRILIQLDSDPQPSVFDRVVAVDAGADHVFSYGNVQLEQVRAVEAPGVAHLKYRVVR